MPRYVQAAGGCTMLLLQVHAITLLIAAAAFTDTAQEEKLAALEAENLRLRVHLSQELDLLKPKSVSSRTCARFRSSRCYPS